MNPALALVAVLAVLRMVELVASHRNESNLKRRGGFEVDRPYTLLVMAFHGLYLAGFAAEAWWRRPEPVIPLPAAIAIVLALEGLRLWCVRSLGDRWSVRVLAVPGEPRIRTGPYRWIRHPNYLVVAVEMIAFPFLFGCPFTALVGGGLKPLVVARRIAAENRALEASP